MNWDGQYPARRPRRSQAPPAPVIVILVLMAASLFVKFVILGPPKWVDYQDPAGRFTVSFPSEPQPVQDAGYTPVGSIRNSHFEAKTRGGRDYFRLEYFDFPASIYSVSSKDMILDKGLDSFVADVGGTLVSRAPLYYYSSPGREAVCTLGRSQRKATLWLRIFLVNERLYVLIYGTMREDVATRDAKRFMNSFRTL